MGPVRIKESPIRLAGWNKDSPEGTRSEAEMGPVRIKESHWVIGCGLRVCLSQTVSGGWE